MRRLKVELARRIVAATRAVQSALHGVGHAVESRVAGVLASGLTHEEKEALGVALYEDAFNPANDREGLYPWEERWFAQRLPAPPARLLIGGAGSGREAVVLERLGYSLVALEPSPRAAAHCRKALTPSATVLQASYRDLAAIVIDHADLTLPVSHRDRFDAVLLGWGSFGHVLRADDRLRLLRACDVICPTGPILLSLFRPAVPATLHDTGEGTHAFFAWGGFLAHPSPEELGGHARALNRDLIAALDSASPYFTLESATKTTDVHANRDPDAPAR